MQYIADTHTENNPWTGVDEWALKVPNSFNLKHNIIDTTSEATNSILCVLQDEVDKLINATLREREREIVRLYYGLDNECLTWEDISRRYVT